MGVEAIFVDDDGVISDNERRPTEWRRVLGSFLADRLGGVPENWAVANKEVVQPLWDEMFSAPLGGRRFLEVHEPYLVRWVGAMCEAAGVRAHPDAEALALGWEARRVVTSSISVSFPFVAEAVGTLAELGIPLHTASGECSWDLEGYLQSAGVWRHFHLFFGIDLVNELKLVGTRYNEEIFRIAGVEPARALVVDDSPIALDLAAEARAATILVGPEHDGLPGALDRVLQAIGG